MKFCYCKLLLLGIIVNWSAVAMGQLISHSYRFYNNFEVSAPGCGNPLTQAQSLGSSCYPGTNPGDFINDMLPYCGSTRTVYHTNLNWGLKYPNTNGTITGTYTIHMYVRNTSYGTRNWARIIDFSDGISDYGIYYYGSGTNNRCLDFYPAGIVGTCPYFNTTDYYLLTFTRNAATKKIDVYVNSLLFATYNDSGDIYTSVAGKPVYIYRDDQTITCESGAANFAYLSFSNQYSSPQEVVAVYNDICGIANASGTDFSLSANSSCIPSQNITVAYTGYITPPGTGYTFSWNWDGGNVTAGSGMGPYTVNWNTPGTKNITLTVTNTNCGGQEVKTKSFIQKGPVYASINQTICQGQTYSGHNSTGIYNDTFAIGSGCDSIRTLNLTVNDYSRVSQNAQICKGQKYFAGGAYHTASGSYYDTISSGTSCGTIKETVLTVNPAPLPNLGQDIRLCYGDSVLLSPGSFAGYTWSNGTTQPALLVKSSGVYWVQVLNTFSCKTTDTIAVSNVFCKGNLTIPNAFSPNGDGVNDRWQINDLLNFTQCTVEVLNRWGQRIFSSRGYSRPWDGTYNSKALPLDTYYYIIRIPELNQRYTGWVFLTR